MADALAELGELATKPEANIIKLPNVSARCRSSRPRSPSCRRRATTCRTTPRARQTDEERDVRARYDKVKGSAVNPVLREGNSDRRAPASVKNYAASHPHRMGAWSRRLEDQRRHDGPARLPLQREVRRHRLRRHPAHRARRRRRHRDRAQGVGAGARRRGRRRHVHGRRRAAPLPHRADRPRQGRGRAVLGAPQGHDDEGLRPDHLRPRGAGVLPDAVRAVRRRADGRRHLAQRRARRAALGRRSRCPRATRSRPRSSRASPTAPRWRWSTPTRASPTCTCPPT